MEKYDVSKTGTLLPEEVKAIASGESRRPRTQLLLLQLLLRRQRQRLHRHRHCRYRANR